MTEKFKCVKVVSFTAILIAIIIALSAIVSPMKTNAGMGKFDKAVTAFNNEKKNTIDVVVLGDSEAYSSIIPLEIYEKYGITTYVAASPAQTSYQAYEMLQTVLKSQKPDLCILEINLLFRSYSAAAAVVPKLERMLPIFKYHNMWKEIVDPNYSFDSVLFSDQKGYRYSSTVNASKKTNYMKSTKSEAKVTLKNTTYVNKIIELCKEEEIELFFVRTPSSKNWNYEKHNATNAFAKENNIPFVDLNLKNTVEIDWSHDTYDKGDHMNYYGAHKVTEYLGKYIDGHYDLPDHRNDKSFDDWSTALENFKKKVSE